MVAVSQPKRGRDASATDPATRLDARRVVKIDASNPTASSSPDLSSWVTRAEACDLLHVSHETLSRWIRAGKLNPRQRKSTTRGASYIDVIDPRELMQFSTARKREKPITDGEITARAFDMLETGHPLRDIVRDVRITFERAIKLRDQWLEAGGEDWLVFVDQRRRLVAIASELGADPEACSSVEATLEAIEQVMAARVRAAQESDMQAQATTTNDDRMEIELEVTEGSPQAMASDERLERAICQALDAATPSLPHR